MYVGEPFFDKGNILISKDTNYIQRLQQRNTLMAAWMHTAKKAKKKTMKEKVPLQHPTVATIIHSP
jgi:hypothetical protein